MPHLPVNDLQWLQRRIPYMLPYMLSRQEGN
jgi:hypothetical protein